MDVYLRGMLNRNDAHAALLYSLDMKRPPSGGLCTWLFARYLRYFARFFLLSEREKIMSSSASSTLVHITQYGGTWSVPATK